MRSGKLAAWGAAALVCASALAPAAQAQDFFSQLFGGIARPRQQPYISMPFANDDGQVYAPRGEGRSAMAAAVARRFACGPATGAISRSPHRTMRAARLSCNSFCPASETKVFYGSSIDNADRR